jgi:hypothetical protein
LNNEDSIVVCEMAVGADVTDVGTDTVVGGDDTDASEVAVAVEGKRVRDGF